MIQKKFENIKTKSSLFKFLALYAVASAGPEHVLDGRPLPQLAVGVPSRASLFPLLGNPAFLQLLHMIIM